MNKITKTFTYGQHQVTFETGEIARQASGAVLVRMANTVILVTVVAQKEATPGRDFFPLTVNYMEKTYAAGRIPGGYFKREGKPSEEETLISRLIDRPIRPLFHDDFKNEVQIVATVLSADEKVQTDVPAILGAAAALGLAGVPFNGPVGAARVGHVDGVFVLNPSKEELKQSRLNLVVAGTHNAVLMVESEADQLPEEVMLGAVMYGHQQMQTAIKAINEFVAEAGVQKWDWQPNPVNASLVENIKSLSESDIATAYAIKVKADRSAAIKAVYEKVKTTLCNEQDPEAPAASLVDELLHNLEKSYVRSQILQGALRIDGRDTKTVRPIKIDVGLLPRTHGSALFTRGETQVIAVSTLGTEREAQSIEDLHGQRYDSFMLHYNFPPYCVGETGMMMGPKRREIGHGRLAKRAMLAVVPTIDTFPYTLRVVSEVTESNGSSSMATVCATSLSLMDAGVPVKAAVAGIAMGLIKEDNNYAVLTDILGDEDHLGDMDFKVAGTRDGVTALQMDIKIDGITEEIMQNALHQAKDARLHILGIMEQAIQKPRTQVSEYAPRIITIKINPDKIRDVIGKGGAVIREITESTNSTIDISDDGVIKIAALSSADGESAKRRIEEITAEAKVGEIYEGSVVKLVDFGAFVSILPNTQGLVHISQISEDRIENIRDHLSEGQRVRVKVLEIDRQGRIRLSMKAVSEVPESH